MNTRLFDGLIQRWRTVVAGFPDHRTGDNLQFEMGDIGLSPLAVFVFLFGGGVVFVVVAVFLRSVRAHCGCGERAGAARR